MEGGEFGGGVGNAIDICWVVASVRRAETRRKARMSDAEAMQARGGHSKDMGGPWARHDGASWV